MRGIRMRFEEQPGLCRKTRQAIPAAIRRGLEKRPEVAYALLNAHDCCATEGTERQEKDVAQDLGGLQEYRRITPMALFALQAAADAGEPRVRLNPWRDWPPRRSSVADSACTSPEHRLQAEQQASHRVRSSSRRMPARISMPRSGSARRSLLQLAGTAGQGAGANGGSAARMVCRVAALPRHRPRRAGVRAGRRGPAYPNEAPQHLDDQPSCRRNARRYRPAPRPVRPRPLPLPARAPLAPLLPR